MAEKVAELGIEREYRKYLYYVDGNGNICRIAKDGKGDSEILYANVVERDAAYLYFIDADGDISRSARGKSIIGHGL